MTIFEIIDAFTFYGFDVTALAAATCAVVQLLKVTALKRCQRKVLTFLPFVVGSLLYAAYAAAVHVSIKYLCDHYVTVLEHGFAVGTLSTVIYVAYEQFVRNKKAKNAAESVIATLIDGYVPGEKIEEIAAQIALAIERDVTGDGAKKAAEILGTAVGDEISENDIRVLARLIIETLAHITAC